MALLILDATTKSIEVAMSGAAATTNPDFTAAWADDTGSAFTEGSTDGALNGTSAVTLVAAPTASTRRVVKSITIENKDTANVTITVSYNNNATLRTVAKVTLVPGDTWTLNGTFDTNGALKQTLGSVNLASVSGAFVSGTLKLSGSSSGTATLNPPAAASTYTYTLPSATATLGYLNLPAVGTKTGSYTLATGDVGKYVQVSTGGSITIPDATFAEGDIISIFNNTTGAITITCTITTAYIAGTDTDKATMSLATRGVATILFISGTVCVVSGNVS
jgi:hypothetical protein